MKRINMAKYGFIRNEREDFHDDGNNFKGYATGPNSRLRISKLVSDGHAYLSADMTGNKLDYTEYSKLPHYHAATWKYNGPSLDSLTEQDILDWYNACVAYEKEYIEAESKVVFPTIEELRNQCIKIKALRKQELETITELLNKHGTDLLLNISSDYELRTLRDYYKSLKRKLEGYDPDAYPQTIQYSNYGRNFVKDTNPDLKEDWHFTRLKELIAKHVS